MYLRVSKNVYVLGIISPLLLEMQDNKVMLSVLDDKGFKMKH